MIIIVQQHDHELLFLIILWVYCVYVYCHRLFPRPDAVERRVSRKHSRRAAAVVNATVGSSKSTRVLCPRADGLVSYDSAARKRKEKKKTNSELEIAPVGAKRWRAVFRVRSSVRGCSLAGVPARTPCGPGIRTVTTTVRRRRFA